MDFQHGSAPITWRLHLHSPPKKVYRMLSTDEGRAQFWAESAVEQEGRVHFRFPDGQTYAGKILARTSPKLFRIIYFGGSVATFALEGDAHGGTDLTLTDEGVAREYRCEVAAGWVSVLMALKGATDFGVDLRNHDPHRTWETGFLDN